MVDVDGSVDEDIDEDVDEDVDKDIDGGSGGSDSGAAGRSSTLVSSLPALNSTRHPEFYPAVPLEFYPAALPPSLTRHFPSLPPFPSTSPRILPGASL